MYFKEPRGHPELDGSKRLRAVMKKAGWWTGKTHGNQFQRDWPDLFCCHKSFGIRWIETKSTTGKLSVGQGNLAAEWARFGVGVWVLRDERDYEWLFREPNWWRFV